MTRSSTSSSKWCATGFVLLNEPLCSLSVFYGWFVDAWKMPYVQTRTHTRLLSSNSCC